MCEYEIVKEELKEIEKLFGTEYSNEAKVVSEKILQYWCTIVLGFVYPIDFAKYCKEQFVEHYRKFPNEHLTDIGFNGRTIEPDHINVTPIFKYEPISTV